MLHLEHLNIHKRTADIRALSCTEQKIHVHEQAAAGCLRPLHIGYRAAATDRAAETGNACERTSCQAGIVSTRWFRRSGSILRRTPTAAILSGKVFNACSGQQQCGARVITACCMSDVHTLTAPNRSLHPTTFLQGASPRKDNQLKS